MSWTRLLLALALTACAQTAPVTTTPETAADAPSGSTEPPSSTTPDIVDPPVRSQPDAADVVTTEEPPQAPEEPVHIVPEAPASQPPATVLPPVVRLVAIGDVHGDITALRAALNLAGVIDGEDHWVGGETTVVQVGDQLDRGEDERAIMHWLEDLAEEARAAGGAIYPLLGNHETMNVELDLRYVTEGGYADFSDVPWEATDPLYAEYPDAEKGRIAAFRPGGPYAQLLSRHAIALVVGDTAFVHGGLLPEHAAYGLDAINAETRAWMYGTGERPSLLSGDSSPVWSRHYSSSPDDADCALLYETLDALDVTRLVVAHTVHKEGITSACQGLVWRVDVGLAAYYGGPKQVLLIEGSSLTVLP